MTRAHTLTFCCFVLGWSGCGGSRQPSTSPSGAATSTETKVLETGAKVLQTSAPPAKMDSYLVGFHPMKEHPQQQMEAHHYCNQANEDFAQCALFDANTAQANLTGVEYIISERLFQDLPAAEKAYWHPHNGEILSGQLVAPGLPQAAEKELMRKKMNSYGKTWHVWMTSEGNKMPLGPPMLAWSFNRDGEARPGMVEERDRRMGIDTTKVRDGRQDLRTLGKPQAGVDALKGKFGRPTQDIPGVTQAASGY